MKARNKRDKAIIKALSAELERLLKELNTKDDVCRNLIDLCVKSNIDYTELYNIVQNDHFLLKRLHH